MNELHALMRAEVAKPAPALNYGLELDHPTAGTIYMSVEGWASKSAGATYRPLLASLGDLSMMLSGWRGGLTAPTLTADFWDVAREVEDAWTLKYGTDLRGAVVRGVVGGPNLPAAANWTWFRGVVDKISQSDATKLSVSMRMNDDTLASSIVKATFSERVFTSLPGQTDLRGKGIPYLLGNHDSSGLAARGMLKLFYVGQVSGVAFRYVVALGWWPVVVRVLVDGVEVATPLDYAVTYTLTADARKVTVVDFVSDQGTAEVLADVQDLTSPTGPAACLRQLAADVIWNDYHTASFSLATAPINAASVTAADVFIASHGWGRSYYIPPERIDAADVLKEFGTSYDMAMYWHAGLGELVLVPSDLRAQNDQLYLGPGSPDSTLALRPVLRDADFQSALTFTADPESAITRISGKSGRRGSDGAWLNPRQVIVSRGGVLERVRDDVELPWQPATAESVGNVEHLIATGSSGVSGFTASAGTIHAALAQGPPPGDPGLGTQFGLYVESNTATAIGGGSAVMDLALSDMPEVVAVANVAIWITASANGLADTNDQDLLVVCWVLGGVQYPPGFPGVGYEHVIGVSGPKRFLIAVSELNPATGLQWTRAEINAAIIRVIWTPSNGTGAVDGNKRVRVAQAYGVANYTAAANVSPATLSILSRMAHKNEHPPRIYSVEAPARFLDCSIGDEIGGEDPRKGWGTKPHERARLKILGKRVMPSKSDRCGLVVEDVRRLLTTFRLLGRALGSVDGTSAAGDGMLLVTHGGAVSVARASPKYLDSPAGIDIQNAGPVVKIQNNCWPSERNGTLVERASTNALKRSSFISGTTGLTPSAGSGTITLDATVGEQLFLPNEEMATPQHLLLTAGSPHSTETRQTWPVSDAINSASTAIAVSIDYKGSSLTANDALAFRVVRNTDGFFLNAATRAFQAGAIDNRLPETLTWDRYKLVATSSQVKGGHTYTLSVVLPTGGTVLRQARVGHYQIEDHEWVSSRIPTDAATVTRAADVITIANDKDGFFLWPNKHGAWTWRFATNWSSADLTAGTRFFVDAVTYDASNAWELYYEGGTGYVFKARSGGVNFTASVNVAVVAGVEQTVRVRYSSSRAENGTANTLELIVSDGTTTTRSANVAYTTPVFAAGKVVGIGGHDVTANVQLDGYIVEGRESPYCQTDAEMGL